MHVFVDSIVRGGVIVVFKMYGFEGVYVRAYAEVLEHDICKGILVAKGTITPTPNQISLALQLAFGKRAKCIKDSVRVISTDKHAVSRRNRFVEVMPSLKYPYRVWFVRESPNLEHITYLHLRNKNNVNQSNKSSDISQAKPSLMTHITKTPPHYHMWERRILPNGKIENWWISHLSLFPI